MQIDSRASAAELLSLGYKLFPLAPESKVPRIAGGRGCLDATDNPAIVFGWADRYPGCNWGIGLDGLVVPDVDMSPGKQGRATMERLVAEHGRMPETAVSRTCGGGLHYIYTAPSTPILRGSNIIGKHVDIKAGAEHYIVAPGSYAKVPATPKRPAYEGWYRWLARRPPAPLPSWITEMAKPKPKPPARAHVPREAPPAAVADRALAFVRSQARNHPSIQGQDGSRSLMFTAAGLVVGFLISEDAAIGLIERYFNPKCVPPWSTWEIERAVERAPDWTDRESGWLLNEPRKGRAA